MAEEDSLEISYEKSEIVRNSMIPLIDDAINEFQKIFSDAKKKTTFTNNVWKKLSKSDDYKIEAVLHNNIDNYEDYNIDSMRELLQSFCDQTNLAKQEAAITAEKNMNLKSRLSSTEIANGRFKKVIDELETKIFELLQRLNKEESTRITLIRELKELHDKSSNDKKILKKELSIVKKDAFDYKTENQKLEIQNKKMGADVRQLQERVKYAESEMSSLQTKLSDALHRENQKDSEFSKAQNLIGELKAELENEKIKSQSKIVRIEKDTKRSFNEKENSLNKQIQSYKNEIDQLHEGYSKALEEHRRVAKEAIERLTNDIDVLDSSRMKYYNQYKELLENLNDHKRKVSHDVLRQAILKLTNEFRNDQIKTSQIRKGLQTIDLQDFTNFGGRCIGILGSQHSSSTESPYQFQRNENHMPPTQSRPKNTNVHEPSLRYDITGRHGNNPRN